MSKAIIFVSSKTWEDHNKDGFRTRSGAMLHAFIVSGFVNHIFLFVGTGFKGGHSISEYSLDDSPCLITEILIPEIMPESIALSLTPGLAPMNYKITDETLHILRYAAPIFIWGYQASLCVRIQHEVGIPFFYDVIDYRVNDANLKVSQRNIWKKELEIACKFANTVFCNGEIAYQELRNRVNNRCDILRNGVDPERFRTINRKNTRSGIGFVGVFSKSIDFTLFEFLLGRLSEIDFECYGLLHSEEEKFAGLQTFSNFHWHGKLAPDLVPTFLARCKVGIVPYNPEVTMYTLGDSMKIFEYLAAGTPVVSTNFQPNLQEKFQGLIEICENYDQFASEIRKKIGQIPDQFWQEKAWQFVLSNTWQNRIEQVFNSSDL